MVTQTVLPPGQKKRGIFRSSCAQITQIENTGIEVIPLLGSIFVGIWTRNVGRYK